MTTERLNMRFVSASLLWIAGLAGVFAVIFALSRGLSLLLGADQRSVDGGVIATFTAVAGGIPVALAIDRLLDARRGREAAVIRNRQLDRLLRTIQQDLRDNLDELVTRDRSQAVVPYLRTDVWHILAGSSQFALIADSELLSVLARAYHRIATTADLERQVWEAFHDPSQWTHRIDRVTGADVTGRSRNSLEAAVRDQDPRTKAAIDVALEHLARRVPEGASQSQPAALEDEPA